MGSRSIMRAPADQILSEKSVKYRTSVKGATTWYNLDPCPVCEKGDHQCGVSEMTGRDGGLVHGFKCQHSDETSYEAFLTALGYDLPPAPSGKTVRRPAPRPFLAPAAPSNNPSAAEPHKKLNPLNMEANARYRKRLVDNSGAMEYLSGRGLTAATIERFKLGLSNEYVGKDGKTSGYALTYPMIFADGHFYAKNGYYNIPGVTLAPMDVNGWMKGSVEAYYGDAAGERPWLMVCEGAKDLWRVWQEIQGTELADKLLLVTSTHGTGLPENWRAPEFWQGWEKVFAGHDSDEAGDKMALRIAGYAERDVLRVRTPETHGKDWTDFFQAGGTVEALTELLDKAPIVTTKIQGDDEDGGPRLGDNIYNPIDIAGAYHKGHLHYVTRVLSREVVPVKLADGMIDTQLVERKVVKVVRSDGRMLSVHEPPAPPGTPKEDRILRLSDGTLLERRPAPSPYASWSWPSILRFQSARGEGRPVAVRPLPQLYRDVRRFLESRVWLPYRDDYTMLALTALATYVQPVFESVPLFLVSGPKGTGKTEIGRAMTEVCANACMIGQGSAATIARLIDMTRGFVVLDDLEAVGRKKGGDDQFSELIQGLKLSYKKSTAVKIWTDVKTMQVERLNFFGIKMVNNTSGVDQILGSRMLTVQTRKRLPAETAHWEQHRTPPESFRPGELRDELHTWAFQSVQEVDQAYQVILPQGQERSDEIAAPLRALAALMGDDIAKASLERALERQGRQAIEIEEPEDLLEEALHNLVREGFREVAVQHIILEMRKIAPENFGAERTTDIPVWSRAEWVGRKLRNHGWVDVEQQPRRFRFLDMQWRALTLAKAFVEDARERLQQEGEDLPPWEGRGVTDFCKGCHDCPYRAAGCDIAERRLAAERRPGFSVGLQ